MSYVEEKSLCLFLPFVHLDNCTSFILYIHDFLSLYKI